MKSPFKTDFPLLSRELDGVPITYLDAASTTPKPQVVIDAVARCYRELGANVHRGVHPLGESTTEAFERARHSVASLIGASPQEIVFTHNATESFNLVAHGLGLEDGDEVVLPASEHHSNLLPWRAAARVVPVDLDAEGVPRYQELSARLSRRTRLASVAHVSNVAGVIAPVEDWVQQAHAAGVPVMIDASQSVSHLPLDVRALGCDFLAFSSHKMFGPSGVGVLYVSRERHGALGLFNLGGGMVATCGEERFEPREPPLRWEAGTPNIEGVIGLGAAVGYLRAIGLDRISAHSRALGAQLLEGLRALPGARVVGAGVPSERRIALCSVWLPVPSTTATGLARLLADAHGILVSGGQHCAQLLHGRLGLEGTVRASAHLYNDEQDIERLLAALRELL